MNSTSLPPPITWTRILQRHGLKILVSIVIALAFIWALRRGGLPILPSRVLFASVRWEWVALHVLLLMGVHTIRAARLRHLLYPLDSSIKISRVFYASWIGFFAILMLPLRAGEVVRPYLIRDRKNISMSAALGTMGAERVIDGLIVTLVLAFALFFVPRLDPLPSSFGNLKIPVAAIPTAGYMSLILFVGAFIAMTFFYVAHDFAQKLVMLTLGRIHQGLGKKVGRILEGIANGLHFLAGPRYAIPFLIETLAYWILNALGMWALGIGCGLSMNFGHACAVMGVLAVGILVPAGPGLFGAFQAATYGALAMYFSPTIVTDQGAVYVFLLYIIQFIWHILAAIIALRFKPKSAVG